MPTRRGRRVAALALATALAAAAGCAVVEQKSADTTRGLAARVGHPMRYRMAGADPALRASLDHALDELAVGNHRAALPLLNRALWDVARIRKRELRLAETITVYESLERAYALFPQLAERRDHRGRTLSGGERRQLALARGLMREAQLLIVDEPSLGLAPVVIDAVYGAIADVARGGTTLLLVEENFTHIADVADRVCLMEMGRIVRDGTFDELISDRTVAESYLGML